MVKANGLDRPLLQGLHQRFAYHPEPVSDTTLRAAVRMLLPTVRAVRKRRATA